MYEMNENYCNHNSRQKEICYSNQNSCLPILVLQWKKPILGPLRVAVKKLNHLFYDSDKCVRYLDLETFITKEVSKTARKIRIREGSIRKGFGSQFLPR